ncbi:hypothetical protein C3Y92_15455 [Solidesulfovibrio carbinolicus]|uniref:Uncharacterized protein n=1 Tax=Solidesulfovibrio carbinolicus TaxID=296842 RepID=A0A4P6I3R8_9BACT|nr:hypothetical protein C3Y92_15455 [Solidesulfovibrio carbinolicus]
MPPAAGGLRPPDPPLGERFKGGSTGLALWPAGRPMMRRIPVPGNHARKSTPQPAPAPSLRNRHGFRTCIVWGDCSTGRKRKSPVGRDPSGCNCPQRCQPGTVRKYS